MSVNAQPGAHVIRPVSATENLHQDNSRDSRRCVLDNQTVFPGRRESTSRSQTLCPRLSETPHASSHWLFASLEPMSMSVPNGIRDHLGRIVRPSTSRRLKASRSRAVAQEPSGRCRDVPCPGPEGGGIPVMQLRARWCSSPLAAQRFIARSQFRVN